MNILALTGLAFAAVLLDSALAPGADVWGGRAGLTLTIIAVWSVTRPVEETMVLAPVAGLATGLVGREPLGVSVLAYALVALPGVLLAPRGGRERARVGWDRPATRGRTRQMMLTMAAAALGTVVYAVTQPVLARMWSGEGGVLLWLTPVLLVMIGLNAALAALLYWPLTRGAGARPARLPRRRPSL